MHWLSWIFYISYFNFFRKDKILVHLGFAPCRDLAANCSVSVPSSTRINLQQQQQQPQQLQPQQLQPPQQLQLQLQLLRQQN